MIIWRGLKCFVIGPRGTCYFNPAGLVNLLPNDHGQEQLPG